MTSGYTNPETISRIGRQLGTRYIMAGSITNLGSQQILVISIMQIDNLQMIAGDWRTYQNITELRAQLPAMAQNIVEATQRDTTNFQKLAVLPFQMPVGNREADVLAQILAVEIVQNGVYAVFPRTKTLEQVQSEYQNQLNGNTADEYVISIGRGENPLLALSGAARALGNTRMFNAAVINVQSGVQEKGETVDYNVIEDGITAMRTLAVKLTEEFEFRVSNNQEFNFAINKINRQGAGNYNIILTGNITTTSGIRFEGNAKKTITIRGENSERSIHRVNDNGFIIEFGSGITVVLGGNLRLSSQYAGIFVDGILHMESGTTITNCTDTGVYVNRGSFIMNGGTISNNGSNGVQISQTGSFIMNGGIITGNTGRYGGGVYVSNISSERNTTFIMNGGTISNNTAIEDGGGVFIRNSVFLKTGGTITNNRAGDTRTNTVGGLMYNDGTFTTSHSVNRRNAAGSSVNLDSRREGRAGGWE